MKKEKKRRRLKVGRLFMVLIILALISFLITKLLDVRIMRIDIRGNNILTDDEVIRYAKLENYPSFLKTLTFNVKNDIKKGKYVKDVKVYKGIFSIKIRITEEKVLYIDKNTMEKVTLEERIKDDKSICAPYLINEVPSDKKAEFNKAMSKINSNIICLMSEIKYDPNEIDKDRYYVNMNDGNGVYLTVNKFNKLNNYNKILENIGRQNGILYLDYGDYFKAY